MLKFSILTKTNRLNIIVVTFFVSMFWSLSLSAKDVPVKLGRMKLSFQAEENFIPKAFRQRLGEDWQAFCEDFGASFVVGKGPQGRGVFNKVECSAIQFVKIADEVPSTDDPWHFVFTWKEEGLGITLFNQPKGAKKTDRLQIAKISFPKQLTPDLLFRFPEPKFYVMNKVYRHLPFAWSITINKADIQWQLSPLAPQMLSSMAPARKVGLFGISFDSEQKIWVPTLFATAQAVVSDDSSREYDRDGSGPLELKWVRIPNQPKVRLWAQEITNPLEKEADPSFLAMRDDRSGSSLLDGYALEGLKSNTVTLKYATPFPKGSTVVSKASKVELTLNVGKGMLEGLTAGVELSPRLEIQENGETYSYTWNRFEIGWSFMLGAPTTIDRFASRFRLTPKVGMLSLDAYFPLAANENFEAATNARFEISRQIDLGGEFSWELESLSYRVKAWATAHFSGYILAPSNPTKILNLRTGGDLSYDIWKSQNGFRLGALAFGYIDWVTLQREAAPQFGLSLASSTTASGASYNVTYIGAGLSLTW